MGSLQAAKEMLMRERNANRMMRSWGRLRGVIVEEEDMVVLEEILYASIMSIHEYSCLTRRAPDVQTTILYCT
jgi:hypothetical protein